MGHDEHHAPSTAAVPGEVSSRTSTSSSPTLNSLSSCPAPPSRAISRASRKHTHARAQPTPYVSDPTRNSTTRCKRRWNDLVLLRLDAMAPKTYTGASAAPWVACRRLLPRAQAAPARASAPGAGPRPPPPSPLSHLVPNPAHPTPPLLLPGPAPRFPQQMDLLKLVRERYLLFAQCVESKPGQEPNHPYLYPQVAVAAAHH